MGRPYMTSRSIAWRHLWTTPHQPESKISVRMSEVEQRVLLCNRFSFTCCEQRAIFKREKRGRILQTTTFMQPLLIVSFFQFSNTLEKSNWVQNVNFAVLLLLLSYCKVGLIQQLLPNEIWQNHYGDFNESKGKYRQPTFIWNLLFWI